MSWKTIGRALKNPDMRKRLMWVFFLILLFRLFSVIPIPLAEPVQLQQLLSTLFEEQQLLGFLNLLSGGALANFSIMLLGLAPYINASIIMQLLGRAVPKLEALNKEGEAGRRKISQYTRIITLPLAILQSIGFIFLLQQQASAAAGIDLIGNASAGQWVLMVSTLTGGAMLLMWMGELMSEQGVGNGISLLIFAGIVSQLPLIIGQMISIVAGGAAQLDVFGLFTLPISGAGLILAGGLALFTVGVTYFVVKLNEAQRIITVSYAKRVRGNRAYGGVDTVLPVKLITAGVIPIIFAVAFLSVPFFVGQILTSADSESLATIGQTMVEWFNPNGLGSTGSISFTDPTIYVYPAMYFLLVVVFTYFYTGIMFNSKEIAENLQKQGGFVAGIRPGKQTELYLKRIVTRLTLFGSTALGLLAIMPFLVDGVVISIFGTPVSSQLTIGGTGLLITVAVAIETLRQIDSRALMITYDSED